MVDPIVYPPEALTAGCRVGFEIVKELNDSDYTFGSYWAKFYKFILRESSSYRFVDLQINYERINSGPNSGTNEYHFDRFSIEDIGNGVLIVPQESQQGRNVRPFYEESWTYPEYPDTNEYSLITMVKATFEKVMKGELLHGRSGAIICGASGLPLYDL